MAMEGGNRMRENRNGRGPFRIRTVLILPVSDMRCDCSARSARGVSVVLVRLEDGEEAL